MDADKKPNKAIAALIVIVLVGLVAGGGALLRKDGTSGDQIASTSKSDDMSDSKKSQDAMTVTNADNYKDGMYMGTGQYDTPGGQEEINVKLTIADNKVKSADVEPTARPNSAAARYQSDFISGFMKLVVGKPVNEVKLDRVAGSSLTPNGFNTAYEMIKQDAAA